MSNYNDKPVCLVTGAGGLLGNALCKQLLQEYHVVATFQKTAPSLPSQRAEQIGPDGSYPIDSAVYEIRADLTNRSDIRRMVDIALARFGRIDCVINSAVKNIHGGKLIEYYQSEDYAPANLDLNTVAPFYLISYIHDHCWKDNPKENRRWNRNVINVSSIAGVRVFSTSEAFYSASKAAMNMLTLHLALELAPYSVRANAICPYGFSGPEQTGKVAARIKDVMEGSASGTIVT